MKDSSFKRLIAQRVSAAIGHIQNIASVSYFSSLVLHPHLHAQDGRRFPLGLFEVQILQDAEAVWAKLEMSLTSLPPISLSDVKDVFRDAVYEHLWVEVVRAMFWHQGEEGDNWTVEARDRAITRLRALEADAADRVMASLVTRSLCVQSEVVLPFESHIMSNIPACLSQSHVLYESDTFKIVVGIADVYNSDEDVKKFISEYFSKTEIDLESDSASPNLYGVSHFIRQNLYANYPMHFAVTIYSSKHAYKSARDRAVLCAKSALASLLYTNQFLVDLNDFEEPVGIKSATGYSEYVNSLYQAIRDRQNSLVSDWETLCEIGMDRPVRSESKLLRARLHSAANYLCVADNNLVPTELRFLNSISALEAMLSRGKEAISEQLAMSVACLVEPSLPLRTSVIDAVKKLYSIRSKIVHGDFVAVSRSDYTLSRKIAGAVMLAVVDREKFRNRIGLDPEPSADFVKHVYECAVTGRSVDGVDFGRALANSIWPDRQVPPNS